MKGASGQGDDDLKLLVPAEGTTVFIYLESSGGLCCQPRIHCAAAPGRSACIFEAQMGNMLMVRAPGETRRTATP